MPPTCLGVAPNKFLAKLASDHGKPDGFVEVLPNKVTEFLAPLPVSRLWGVGAKGEKRLHALGLNTVGQIAALPENVLVGHFGDHGSHLWQLAHGIDGKPVLPDREAKSISTETTFASDFSDLDALRSCLLDLVDHLAGRLRSNGLRARTIDLKVRSSDFHTRTRSMALEEATDVTKVLWQAAKVLFDRTVSKEVLPVRLLGVAATRLTCSTVVQGDLYNGEQRERQSALDQAVGAIREQFRVAAIQRGVSGGIVDGRVGD